MIPITKREIIAHLEGSPLMKSIREGSLEELLNFREDWMHQIQERKTATWRSYGSVVLLAVLGCSVIAQIAHFSLQQLIIGHIASLLICSGFWGMTSGSRFYRAIILEKVMTTLVDAAIAEKQLTTLHRPAADSSS